MDVFSRSREVVNIPVGRALFRNQTENHTIHFWESRAIWGFITQKLDSPFLMKRRKESPTNSDTTKHDRLGDSRCDVLSSSVETRPEPDGTRRRSTADRESRMKSRASRSSCGELPFSENTTTAHAAGGEPRRHCLSRCVQNRDWYPARSCGSRRAPRGGGPTGKCTEAFYGRDRDAPAAPLVESRLPTAIEAVWRPFGAAARPA